MSPSWKTKGSLDWWIKEHLIKDSIQECNKRALEQWKLCFISQDVSLFSSQKHLKVFEIWKPVVLPYRPSSCIVISRCSIGQCSTALQEWNCLSKQSLLQLQRMVSDSSFQDVMLLTILCYCGYLNGFMEDKWKITIQTDIHVLLVHLTMVPMCSENAGRCKVTVNAHTVLHSHAGNISAKCVTFSSARDATILWHRYHAHPRTMFAGRLISHSGPSPGQPACLILQYQTTASASMSKARYMKHVLPNSWPKTTNLEAYSRICYNVLQ
jgi:hypothetical protein